jgi:hypothetical protein
LAEGPPSITLALRALSTSSSGAFSASSAKCSAKEPGNGKTKRRLGCSRA